MKAFVTSIGEPTTDLCVWSLTRLGYDVTLVQSHSSLAEKLQWIYNAVDEDFLRVDADVVVNKNVLNIADYEPEAWWIQAKCFGWYAQDLVYGGVQFIRREALPALRKNIGKHLDDERPETSMSRLPEFYDPRRFISVDLVCGLHGWAQNDLERIKETKARRGQFMDYDWKLVEEMEKL